MAFTLHATLAPDAFCIQGVNCILGENRLQSSTATATTALLSHLRFYGVLELFEAPSIFFFVFLYDVKTEMKPNRVQ